MNKVSAFFFSVFWCIVSLNFSAFKENYDFFRLSLKERKEIQADASRGYWFAGEEGRFLR